MDTEDVVQRFVIGYLKHYVYEIGFLGQVVAMNRECFSENDTKIIESLENTVDILNNILDKFLDSNLVKSTDKYDAIAIVE